MINFLKDVFIVTVLTAGITFFAVMIWAVIYSVIKMYRGDKND